MRLLFCLHPSSLTHPLDVKLLTAGEARGGIGSPAARWRAALEKLAIRDTCGEPIGGAAMIEAVHVGK